MPDWVALSSGRTFLTDAIMLYEEGKMSDEDVVVLFQHLVDIDLAWKLQGHYGRVATALIDAGLVHRRP